MIPKIVSIIGPDKTSYLLCAISQILFPLAFIYSNDKKINPVQTSIVRGIVCMLVNFAIIRYYDMGLDYKYDVNFYNLFKRNTIVVVHGLAIATAQFYMPLPIVHTINFSAPIFIIIIDYFQNGVKISKIQFLFLMFGVFGILCTLNDELITKILDPEYELVTDFKNYISLDPKEFTIYASILVVIMFFWAYGILRVRTFHKGNHTYVNFHLGLLFVISSGFLYPLKVTQRTDFSTLCIAGLMTGLPLTIGQLLFTAGLALNKKSGQIVVLTGIPVLIGYLISYFRYGEKVQGMQAIGSILILVGILGVINCVEKPANNFELLPTLAAVDSSRLIAGSNQTKILKDSQTDVIYSFIRMG